MKPRSTTPINLILAWIACQGLTAEAGDISNAYFQAENIDRLIMMKPPRGGIPGRDPEEHIRLVACKPIYGTEDAGRWFYKRFRKVATAPGRLTEARLMPGLYYHAVDGDIKILCGTHVDDFVFAAKPGYRHIMQEILDEFELREYKKGTFRFAGREVQQDLNTMSIKVTCKDNIEKVLPINFEWNGRSEEDSATDGERSQLQSVNGSLSFVARQAQIWEQYDTSRLQSIARIAKVKHLEECNRVLQDCVDNSDQGLFFKGMAFNWDELVVLSIGDASWANDTKVVNDNIYPRRSQFGRLCILAGPEIWNSEQSFGYPISSKSSLIHRVRTSTMGAETHGQMKATATGDYIRATLAEISGKTLGRKWEAVARQQCQHLWLSDCKSFVDYVNAPIAAGTEDKRLEIDLEQVRQFLWEYDDGSIKDFLHEDQRDKCRWIDTATMLADCLTKVTKSKLDRSNRDRLIQFCQTGVLDFETPPEAQMKKVMQQAQRQRAKEQKKSALQQQAPPKKKSALQQQAQAPVESSQQRDQQSYHNGETQAYRSHHNSETQLFQ